MLIWTTSPQPRTSRRELKGNARWSKLTPKSQRDPRRWAGLTSTAYCARSIEGHSSATTCTIFVVSTRTALRSRIVGAQEGPSLIRRDPRAEISCSSCAPKSRRAYANIRTRTTNAAHVHQIVIETPTTVPEGVGRIALRNHVYVRNVN